MVNYVKILLVAFLTVSAAPAFSDMAPPVSVVAEELADQGYQVSKISKTFWGRVKIVANKDDLEREVVVNPNTGEILRDLVRRLRLGQRSDNSGSDRQGAMSGSDGDDDISDDGNDGDEPDETDESDESDETDESDESDETDESDESDSSDSSDSPDESDDD